MSAEQTKAVATIVPAPQGRSVDIFSDPQAFEHAQRVAKVFASSKLVPQHLQGNVADCLIALQIARRLNEEPLTVMQNIYIVSGRPGWYTSYVIARANRSGVFKSQITWKAEGAGEALAVTATAILAGTGEMVCVTCDMRMAKAEGWTKNAKYTSMPEHMLRWRSAAMLIRLYSPEVMLGMPVIEEIETQTPAEMRDVTPTRTVNEALDAFAQEHDATRAPSGGEATADLARSAEASPAADQASPQSQAPTEQTATGQAAAGNDTSLGTQPIEATDPAAATATWPADKVPANPSEYAACTKSWLEQVRTGAISPEDARARWKGEMKLRNNCMVDESVRDPLKEELDAILAAAKKAA